MNTWSFKLLAVMGCCWSWAGSANGQDLHFSQFYTQAALLNPALSATSQADWRWGAVYRHQWQSVPVPYLTAGSSFEKRFGGRRGGGFAAGLSAYYDQAGLPKLSWTDIGLHGAYAHPLGPKLLLAAGARVNFRQRAFNTSGLTFDNQFDGDIFRPGLDSREQFANMRYSFVDAAAGIGLAFREADRYALQGGASVGNLTRPSGNFTGTNKTGLPMRFNVHAGGTLSVGTFSELQLAAYGAWQGSQQEQVVSGGWRFFLAGGAFAMMLGGGYRVGDAAYPLVELKINNWTAGLTYDVNLSDFDVATRQRGGPEFTLTYTSLKVKSPQAFKVCPVF